MRWATWVSRPTHTYASFRQGEGLKGLLTRRAAYSVVGFAAFFVMMVSLYEYQESFWQALRDMRESWTSYGIW